MVVVMAVVTNPINPVWRVPWVPPTAVGAVKVVGCGDLVRGCCGDVVLWDGREVVFEPRDGGLIVFGVVSVAFLVCWLILSKAINGTVLRGRWGALVV